MPGRPRPMQEAVPPAPPPAPAGTVSRRLRRMLQVFLVATLVTAGAGLAAAVTSYRALDEMIERIDPARSANRDVLDIVLDADTELRGYRLTWDEDFLPPYRAAVARYPAAWSRAMIAADGDEELRAALDEQDRLFQQWRAYATEVERLGGIDREAAEALVRTGRGRAMIDRIRAANDRAADHLDAADGAAEARSRRAGLLAGVATIAALLFGATAGALSARKTRRLVAEPLERLLGAISAQRRGDRAARAQVEGVHEVREVTAAFNRLAAEDEAHRAGQEARLEQERTVRDVGRRIRSTLDPAVVMRLTADALGPATEADRIAIRPIAASGRALEALQTEWTSEDTTTVGAGAPVEPHPELLAHVLDDLAAGRTVLLEDTSDHPDLSPEALAVFREAGWGSVALVPVVHQRDVEALIVLESRTRGHRWSPDDIRLAEAVAAEMSLAVQTARLFAQEREMVARLQEVDQAKSDFVSTVSHELRTPLTSIRGYVEMLRDGDAGDLDAAQDAMLGVVDRNTDRLMALIEDLLTLSRIESGSFKVARARLDLVPLLDGCLQTVAPQAEGAGVRLVRDVAEPLPPLVGDAHQLERLVLNLLTNAVKFSEAGGDVTLSARPDGDAIVVEVADRGMGIPEAEQDQLFSRFFRSSTAQERAVPGTGLGLVIAKAAVDNHGGRIDVRSAPGRGTTFTVELPVAAPAPVGAAP